MCTFSAYIAFHKATNGQTDIEQESDENWEFVSNDKSGGRGGSIGRASASRSNGLHDQWFKSRPEHKKNEFFRVKMLYWLVVGVPHPRVYTHA